MASLNLKLAAIWFAVMIAVALFFPYWHYADVWILTDVLGYGRTGAIDERILPVDLGAQPGAIRPPVLALLEAICRPDRDPAAGPVVCTQAPLALPEAIALDIIFDEGAGDPKLVPAIANTILGLRADRVGVYGAVATEPSERPVARIADALSGLGHTKINVVPIVPTGFAWYRRVATIGGTEREALPFAIKGITGDRDESGTEAIIPLGPHAEYARQTWNPQRVISALAADRTLDQLQNGQLEKKYVVIGNGATDVQIPGHRTGFELVVWAISDRIADPDRRTRLAYDTDTPLMLIVLLVASALAAISYPIVFRRVRTRPTGYAIAFAAAAGASFAALGALEAILLANHHAFAQLSLVGIGTLTATGLSARASAEAVKHERFLTKTYADATFSASDQYDVFISYARDPENSKWVVENVYEPLLRTVGPDGRPLRIFFDRESIAPGSDWYDSIVRSIHGSRFFLPVYSRGYFQRWFCRDELELALLCRPGKPKNFIVPLTRIGYRLPKRYASIQALDTNSPVFAADLTRVVAQAFERSPLEALPHDF